MPCKYLKFNIIIVYYFIILFGCHYTNVVDCLERLISEVTSHVLSVELSNILHL